MELFIFFVFKFIVLNFFIFKKMFFVVLFLILNVFAFYFLIFNKFGRKKK